MSSNDNCICCGIPVRARQEGLQCETCLRWQHRTCQTGISQRVYREAVKSGQAIDWHCSLCFEVPQLNAEPDFESTRLDEVLETLPCASTRGSEDLFPEHASESARLQEHSETSSVTRASEVLIPDCEESSIEEPDIVDCSIDDCPPTIAYEVIEDSTKRGKHKLADNRGYTYNVKRQRLNATDWQCTVKPKVM